MTSYEELPGSLSTLYAELLDQTIRGEAEASSGGAPVAGSFIRKEIRGRTYWYLQKADAVGKRQIYLGADSSALRRWIEDVESRRAMAAPDQERREEMVAMLRTGKAHFEPRPPARVLAALADIGLFRHGGVLLGTVAFANYGNALGVRFPGSMGRTQDVDIGSEPSLAIALDPEQTQRSIEALVQEVDDKFFAVPGLSHKEPSTSFGVRGRDLRVDFLTPETSSRRKPVKIRPFGVWAQPLKYLDYLLDETMQAVILFGDGVLVNLPDPARFALHKLWVATERPATFTAQARKDREQVSTLLEVLADISPGSIRRAATAARERKGLRRALDEALDRFEEPVARLLEADA